MSEPLIGEDHARKIFVAAIAEQRCDEMFSCLIEGGSVTLDSHTGRLVLITAAELKMLAGFNE